MLNGFHHLAEQFVANALDDHQNGVGMVLLELLGIGIELEAAFLSRFQDGLTGFFADMGMTVQCPGNGAYRVAGFCRQIFDGHWHTFLPESETADQPFTAPAATPLMMCFWQKI